MTSTPNSSATLIQVELSSDWNQPLTFNLSDWSGEPLPGAHKPEPDTVNNNNADRDNRVVQGLRVDWLYRASKSERLDSVLA
jgi:hypothetical protein